MADTLVTRLDTARMPVVRLDRAPAPRVRRGGSRSRRRALSLGVALCVALGGCAIVSSTPHDGGEGLGIPYMLPKALLPVELLEADGVLLLRVMPPVLIGDPNQRYLLRHGPSVTSEDDVKIEVDDATGLLKKITASSTDETLAILKEAIAFARARNTESAKPGETLLFSGLIDPDSGRDQEANRNLLRAVRERASGWVAECPMQAAAPATSAAASPAVAASDAAKCASARALQGEAASADGAFVEVTPLADFLSGSAASAPRIAPPASARCEAGICLRALQPFIVRMKLAGLDQSIALQLPNLGAPIVLPVERAAFVKTEHTIVLEKGQLQSAHTKRPSSALALVKWPLDIYSAILTATSKIVSFRIGQEGEEVKLADAKLKNERELIRIREETEALRKTESQAPSARGLTGPSRGGALMAAEFGQRRSALGRSTGVSVFPAAPPASAPPAAGAAPPPLLAPGAPVSPPSPAPSSGTASKEAAP